MDRPFAGNQRGSRPRMLMCYLCGREFGTRSLPIHIPQCQKKWLAAEELKPVKDRLTLPQAPSAELPIKVRGAGDAQAIDDFNETAFQQFQASLEKCPFCERKFKPDAYKHHQKSCSASNPAKPAGTGLTAASLSNRLVPGAIAGSMHGSKLEVAETAVAGTSRMQRKKSKLSSAQKFPEPPARTDGMKNSNQGQSSGASDLSCIECGALYPCSDANFCYNCGTKFKAISGEFGV